MDLSKTQRTTKQTGVLRPAVAAQVVRKEEKPVTNTPMPVAVVAPVATGKDAHREAWNQLEVVLSAALDIAYSDSLPADAPGASPRTVEVRRRHWLYLAAVSFATYNPVLAADEEAVVEAVALAHDLMLDRDAAARTSQEKDARIRRMNGLPPTADAAPVSSVAPAPAKAYDQALARGVEKAMSTLMQAGQKFTDAHVERNPRLKVAAVEYLDRYAGDNTFMRDVRRKLDVRPEFRNSSITVAQARGVLNVWLSVYRDSQKPTPR